MVAGDSVLDIISDLERELYFDLLDAKAKLSEIGDSDGSTPTKFLTDVPPQELLAHQPESVAIIKALFPVEIRVRLLFNLLKKHEIKLNEIIQRAIINRPRTSIA